MAEQLFDFLDAHPTGWQFSLEYDDEKVLDIAREVWCIEAVTKGHLFVSYSSQYWIVKDGSLGYW